MHRIWTSLVCLLLVFALPVACSAPPMADADAGELSGPDAEVADAGSKASGCAAEFGSALTNAHGRLDGTVVAVVGPADSWCPIPNSDHLVVQVQTNGAVYRMVVNILSDGRNGTDTRLRYAEIPHPLVGGAWSEGWHPATALDYPASLDAHTAQFTPVAMDELVQKVTDRLAIGAHISVFATSSGGAYASSAHLIHRNGTNVDGALVIDPESASPLWLLFHFDGQTF